MSSGSSGRRVAKPDPSFFSIWDLMRRMMVVRGSMSLSGCVTVDGRCLLRG